VFRSRDCRFGSGNYRGVGKSGYVRNGRELAWLIISGSLTAANGGTAGQVLLVTACTFAIGVAGGKVSPAASVAINRGAGGSIGVGTVVCSKLGP
jgi:hypothetical protein